LARRKGSVNWYYREAVPADVREIVFCRTGLTKHEVWKSLGTADIRAANTTVAGVRAAQHKEWEAIRDSVVTASAMPSLDEMADAVVEHIHAGFVEVHLRKLRTALGESLDFANEAQRRKAKIVQVSLLPNDQDRAEMEKLAAALCLKNQWPFGPGDKGTAATWERLLDMVTKAVQHARHLVVETLEGRPAHALRNRVMEELGVKPTKLAMAGETLMDLFSRYEGEHRRLGDKKEDTMATERKVIEHLSLFVGKRRDVASIGFEDIREFKEALSLVPTRWTARPELKGLSLAAAASKWRATAGTGRSATTIRRELSAVSAFFRWLKKNVFHPGPNPTTDLFPPVNKKKNKYPPYTEDQLKAVFSSPLFHDCNAKRPHQPGDAQVRDWRFWLPLCALFTGARAGEIAQLLCEDIRREGDNWIFDLNDNPEDEEEDGVVVFEKSLKTDSSRRQVPVHPALVRLGFIKYVETHRKNGVGRVFPEIRPGPRGNLSHYVSRFWQLYLTRIGVKRKGLALHSFRHTFVDECRRAGVRKDVMQGLLGHSDGTQTDHYGREQPGNPKQRLEAVSALTFFGLSEGLPKPATRSHHLVQKAA
jgi:integrase